MVEFMNNYAVFCEETLLPFLAFVGITLFAVVFLVLFIFCFIYLCVDFIKELFD